jgi:hypothetical protein
MTEESINKRIGKLEEKLQEELPEKLKAVKRGGR